MLQTVTLSNHHGKQGIDPWATRKEVQLDQVGLSLLPKGRHTHKNNIQSRFSITQ
jgi:hypothetical protein